MSLFDLLEKMSQVGDAVEDSLSKAEDAQIVGETAIGRALRLAERVKAHNKLVNKLEERRGDARKNGHAPSTIGSVLDVAEFLLRK